ncbi:glycosyltransferase family protein [Aquibium oceanicum]|uniref:Glycosyltransferase RgtA/B/C/D-like domain-containing protein n=1 Tax=Aquibium oceanicum TaxID=1670800 RepID=A0A1L3SPT4_9HYPH|nr:hypothetical protein [Aquibium oceanicum]APH71408.1 hypothetical protein BSQ44_08535 [Aquibium oceanicum]
MRVVSTSAALIFMMALVKFVIMGTIVVPAWTNADETAHYSYAMEFARGNLIPVHGVTLLDEDANLSQNGEGPPRTNYVLSHPPLYYLAIAPFGAVALLFTDDPVSILKVLRIVTSIMSAAAVAVIFMTATELKLSPTASWSIVGITLATPHFNSLSGGVSNDIGVFLAAAVGSLFLARYLRTGLWKDEFFCLTAFAASAVCKSTGLPLFVGIAAFFAVMRVRDGRLSVAAFGALVAVSSPLIVWHLLGYIYYGEFVRFGSLRTERALDPSEFTFWDFITKSPVMDHFMASFHGHTWIRRSVQDIVMIYVPDGLERTLYIALIGALLTAVSIVFMLDRRYWPQSVALRAVSLAVAAVVGIAGAYLIVGRTPASFLVSGSLGFLGAACVVQGLMILDRSNEAQTRFTMLVIAAFFCMVIVALWNIYQVQLIYGRPRAMHGRYFYSLAPMFLIALVAVLDRRYVRWALPSVLVLFVGLESLYWNGSALPIYTAFYSMTGG